MIELQDNMGVLSLAEAIGVRIRWGHHCVCVTNGCFDLLHRGHVESLEAAAALATRLIVLVNSDDSVRSLKGPERPIVPAEDRAAMLVALRCVSAAVIFDGTNCAPELRALQPEIYAKSEEYRTAQNALERQALEDCGCRIAWMPRIDGFSTSALLRRCVRARVVETSRRTPGTTEVPQGANGWGLI